MLKRAIDAKNNDVSRFVSIRIYILYQFVFVSCINLYLYFVSIEVNCDKVITPQQEDLAVASSARRTSAVVRRSLSSVSQATKPKYDFFVSSSNTHCCPSSIQTNTDDLVYCHLQDFSTIPPLLSSYWRPIFHAEVNILRLFIFKDLRNTQSFAHILHRRNFVRLFRIVLEKVCRGRQKSHY